MGSLVVTGRTPTRPGRQLWPIAALVGAVVAGGVVVTASDPAPPRSSGPAVAGPTALASPSAPRQLRPEQFGAAGDGVSDDSDALQRALNALRAGDTLVLPKGRVYRHDDLLLVTRPGSRVSGPGTLLAVDEEQSSLQLQAPGVHLDGVVLRIASTSKRWTGLPQHRLVLGRHEGLVVRDVHVVGSAGAGVYVDGARDFQIDDIVVSGTRADGIHITGGASDGVVRRPVVTASGDDGVAIVSYETDRETTRHIEVQSPRIRGTTWGRGVSVVGGEDVVYRDVVVEGSSAAGIYLATEGAPFFTRSTRRVAVIGAELRGANTSEEVDHGAVLVVAGGEAGVRDVEMTDLTIRDTRRTASRQVGVLSYGAEVRDVALTDVAVWGGGHVFAESIDDGSTRTTGWTIDGRPVSDPRKPG